MREEKEKRSLAGWDKLHPLNPESPLWKCSKEDRNALLKFFLEHVPPSFSVLPPEFRWVPEWLKEEGLNKKQLLFVAAGINPLRSISLKGVRIPNSTRTIFIRRKEGWWGYKGVGVEKDFCDRTPMQPPTESGVYFYFDERFDGYFGGCEESDALKEAETLLLLRKLAETLHSKVKPTIPTGVIRLFELHGMPIKKSGETSPPAVVEYFEGKGPIRRLWNRNTRSPPPEFLNRAIEYTEAALELLKKFLEKYGYFPLDATHPRNISLAGVVHDAEDLAPPEYFDDEKRILKRLRQLWRLKRTKTLSASSNR